MSARPVLFPLFLKLEGRTVLLVGGNQEVEWKIPGLLASGARVRLVSPTVAAGIRTFVDTGQVSWEQREFVAADLDGATLVIALHENNAVNEEIYREADARGVLCNIVDQPERCHFYYPAVVRRGQLQIAISTGGVSPALASDIRRDLESQYDSAYEAWVDALGNARERVLRDVPRSPRRTKLLKRIASKSSFRSFSRRRAAAKETL